MTEPIWSTGGAGGERAVTEDLEWAVSALRAAADHVASARLEVARRRAAMELSHSVGHAGASAALASLAFGPAARVEAELDDTASRLAKVTHAYLDAERRARQKVTRIEAVVEAGEDLRGRGMWLGQVALAGVAAVSTPGTALIATGNGGAITGLLPDDAPPTTGTLTRDSVEGTLSFAQYAVVVALLARVAAALEGWLGEPGFFAAHGSVVDAQPAASVEDVMHRLRETELVNDGSIRIERWTDQSDVTHRIVYLPGTEDWLFWDGNPVDVEADLALMARQMPQMADLVAAALVADGADPNEPVLLAGHSLGGILATALAANPDFTRRFNVRALVTAGSPVGRITVPSTVSALHLEGTRDIVPGLDGKPNPDTPTRVTVHHDARRSELPELAGEGTSIGSAHHLDTYGQTARLVDEGLTESTDAWMRDAAEFFDETKEVTVTEYTPVTR
ncbi:hypothetical protein [Demequina sp.]|uniref:hypothetical protein n=1 Tax=Demequina sp. TaxID=2050685 RepID=UPI003D12F084